MARDYKHGIGTKETFQRKSQKEPEVNEVPRVHRKLMFLLAGGLSLLFVIGFFVIQHFATHGVKGSKPMISETQAVAAVKKPLQPQSSIIVKTEPTSKPVPVHYTFYQGLAKTEVVVDVVPISIKLSSPYYIQAGSFNTKEMALKELKRLKNKGVTLEMSALTTKKRTYYRLRMGPFENRLVMNDIRNMLGKMGVDTLMIRANVSPP